MKRISFETAMLADEKGYIAGSSYAYDNKGNITHPYYGSIYKNGKDNGDCVYEAPYQEELSEWLRNKHNYLILITPHISSQIIKWNVVIIFFPSDNSWTNYKNDKDFSTYEDALEYGLKYALKNL